MKDRLDAVALVLAALAAPSSAQELLYEVNAGGAIGAVADLDGDGVDEIQIGFSIFSGADGSFIFDTSVSKPTGYVSSHPIGDVDGDGYPDVVFGTPPLSQLVPFSVWSGRTKVHLGDAQPQGWFTGIDGWTWVAGRADVDGDGVPDLVFGSELSTILSSVVVGYLSGAALQPGMTSSAGNFDYPIPGPAGLTADFDGDGTDDGLFRDWNAGIDVHTYVPPATSISSFYGGFVLGTADVDGDGRADAIVSVDPNLTGAPGPLEVLAGVGPAVLTIPGSFSAATGVGDANCDGKEDFLVASTSPAETRLLSGTDGSVLWQTPGVALRLAAVGDVNQDGVGDWAIQLAGGTQVWAGPSPPVQLYCTGKVNSAGCTPTVNTSGQPTALGPDDFVVAARDVLTGVPGLFFWGTSGPTALPFLGGTLCVQPGLQRGPILVSTGPADCDAGYAFLFAQALAQQYGIVPGTTVNGQFWMRDPAHPDGTGVALSDAVEFGWCGI